MMSATRFGMLGAAGRTMIRVVQAFGFSGSRLDPMRQWTQYRVAPDIPRESFRDLWRKRNGKRQ
jgi:hypothetical protein